MTLFITCVYWPVNKVPFHIPYVRYPIANVLHDAIQI